LPSSGPQLALGRHTSPPRPAQPWPSPYWQRVRSWADRRQRSGRGEEGKFVRDKASKLPYRRSRPSRPPRGSVSHLTVEKGFDRQCCFVTGTPWLPGIAGLKSSVKMDFPRIPPVFTGRPLALPRRCVSVMQNRLFRFMGSGFVCCDKSVVSTLGLSQCPPRRRRSPRRGHGPEAKQCPCSRSGQPAQTDEAQIHPHPTSPTDMLRRSICRRRSARHHNPLLPNRIKIARRPRTKHAGKRLRPCVVFS
jgi:hypothetical protein